MATAVLEKKTSRLDLRLTEEQKHQIETAARACGISVSQWSVDRLLASARNDIAEAREIRLSAQAFDAFAKLLEEPVNPVFSEFASRRTMWED